MAVVERDGERLRFRPGGEVADLRGGRWELEGDLAVLEATVEDGRLRSDEYPDPLARVFVGARRRPTPATSSSRWRRATRRSTGAGSATPAAAATAPCTRGDSLGPLLFVGCGPDDAAEREQWALRDVAPVVLEHFGIE